MLYIIACPILIALGVTMLIKPQLFYQLTESWKHEGSSEPSDLFILSTRVGGVLFILIGGATLVILSLVFFNVI